jgi:hypothetical protein
MDDAALVYDRSSVRSFYQSRVADGGLRLKHSLYLS